MDSSQIETTLNILRNMNQTRQLISQIQQHRNITSTNHRTALPSSHSNNTTKPSLTKIGFNESSN